MAISWILFTLMAAFMQAWGNAFQKKLSTTVESYGVKIARFIFAFPLAGLYLKFLYVQQPISAHVSFHTNFLDLCFYCRNEPNIGNHFNGSIVSSKELCHWCWFSKK